MIGLGRPAPRRSDGVPAKDPGEVVTVVLRNSRARTRVAITQVEWLSGSGSLEDIVLKVNYTTTTSSSSVFIYY